MNFTRVAPRKEPLANMTEDHDYSPLQNTDVVGSRSV